MNRTTGTSSLTFVTVAQPQLQSPKSVLAEQFRNKVGEGIHLNQTPEENLSYSRSPTVLKWAILKCTPQRLAECLVASCQTGNEMAIVQLKNSWGKSKDVHPDQVKQAFFQLLLQPYAVRMISLRIFFSAPWMDLTTEVVDCLRQIRSLNAPFASISEWQNTLGKGFIENIFLSHSFSLSQFRSLDSFPKEWLIRKFKDPQTEIRDLTLLVPYMDQEEIDLKLLDSDQNQDIITLLSHRASDRALQSLYAKKKQRTPLTLYPEEMLIQKFKEPNTSIADLASIAPFISQAAIDKKMIDSYKNPRIVSLLSPYGSIAGLETLYAKMKAEMPTTHLLVHIGALIECKKGYLNMFYDTDDELP